jgi:hypothetical protein
VFPAIVAVPAVTAGLGGCSLLGQSAAGAPDPLPGLADAARADAALAASVIAADASLRGRVEPLRAARTAHAAALDRMLGRPPGTAVPAPAVSTARPTTTAAPATGSARPAKAGVTQLHDALVASAAAAADAALGLPGEKVGLVASVAACCSAYAATL